MLNVFGLRGLLKLQIEKRRATIICSIFVLSQLAIIFTQPRAVANEGSKIGTNQFDAFQNCKLLKAVPIVITEPGKYCLVSNLIFEGPNEKSPNLDAITINANDVHLNGRGFEINMPSDELTQSRGILAINRSGITIENISFEGFFTPILIGSDEKTISGSAVYKRDRQSSGIFIKNVKLKNPTFQGINVSASNVRIEDVLVQGVGPTKVHPNAFATGIMFTGNNCNIARNRIVIGQATGTGENVGIAIYGGNSCIVSNNRITFDTLPEYGMNYGIWSKEFVGAIPLISENFIVNAHYAIGPHGVFKENFAMNTVCSLFSKRQSINDVFLDFGNNVAHSTGAQLIPGNAQCMHNISLATQRFKKNKSANAAYQIATAYTESNQSAELHYVLSWLLVAARLGHVDAKNVVNNPQNYDYTPEDMEKAKKLASGHLNPSGSPKIGH